MFFQKAMFIHQVELILFGLICGSLLFSSYLPRKIKKVDVTKLSNDHNPGTANAMKYAGVPVGILCLVCDLLKGALPVCLAVHLGMVTESLFPLIMVAPVLGHAYSLFHHGRGGKGIAVSFGVLIGLMPGMCEPVLLLAAIYIFCSVIYVVNPHPKRTRVTFASFDIGMLILTLMKLIPVQACLGGVLISLIVIHKNSVKQENRELEEAKERAEEQASLEIL